MASSDIGQSRALATVSGRAHGFLGRSMQHPATLQARLLWQRLPVGGKLISAGLALVTGVSILQAILNMIIAVAWVVCFVLCGAYLATKRPELTSFEPAFQEWFTRDYYPRVQQRLTTDQRWSPVLTALGPAVGRFEPSIAYTFWASRCLPASTTDWLLFRTAQVNLGSSAQPMYMTFVGVHDCWFALPKAQSELGNLSLLEAETPLQA
eukprot:CAMPEP_0172683640 /NCGR_PEP_ID=MMETSP1074-20121228/19001_1 /TAXON_ID=2916 /ORGANISM="Ceratium fusus, Strain PA161109" /LENGTH=208 /DNA_ID=CAMNT_0013502527 /DNA_START=74 /DNA_END=700 /DNA_ORIENTATION=-